MNEERRILAEAWDLGWRGPNGDRNIPTVAGSEAWKQAVASARAYLERDRQIVGKNFDPPESLKPGELSATFGVGRTGRKERDKELERE